MQEFIYPLRVHIEDTDFSGLVYHANYLNFFERARSEWVESLGFGIEWQRAHGLLFPVRSAKLDYLKPAYLHQKVEVVSQIKEIRRVSVLYDQYLRLQERPDTILCRAEVKIVCVDLNLKPRALPETFYGEPA
jgi:acyl-CoA thioester hydrolase